MRLAVSDIVKGDGLARIGGHLLREVRQECLVVVGRLAVDVHLQALGPRAAIGAVAAVVATTATRCRDEYGSQRERCQPTQFGLPSTPVTDPRLTRDRRSC